MALNIETFSNITGGNGFFKAVTHPLALSKIARLIQHLKDAGPVAIYVAGAYVGAGTVSSVLAGEPLVLSLGTDDILLASTTFVGGSVDVERTEATGLLPVLAEIPGDLELHDTSPEGTTFRLTLPRAQQDGDDEPAPNPNEGHHES